MKNIYILFLAILFISCEEPKYAYIGQEIIDGKVSKIDTNSTPYFIWVQTPTETRRIIIPCEYRNRWKVGDSCLLIIEKYKENDTE
jgi:hypothetical protein